MSTDTPRLYQRTATGPRQATPSDNGPDVGMPVTVLRRASHTPEPPITPPATTTTSSWERIWRWITRHSDPYRDQISDLGVFTVAVTAAILSWSGQVMLAVQAGVNQSIDLALASVPMSWLYPISVDTYGLVAARVMLDKRLKGTKAASWGRFSAVEAVAISIAGNIAGHALHAGIWQPRWWLIVAVAIVPPIMLFQVVHLKSLRTIDTRARAAKDAKDAQRRANKPTTPANTAQAGPPDTPAPTKPAPAKTTTATKTTGRRIYSEQDKQHMLDKVIALDRANGAPVGRDKIKNELGVGSTLADQLRQRASTNTETKAGRGH